MEELAESFKVFSQDRIQQRAVEQTIEIPAVSLDEKIIEVPVRSDAREGATGYEHACSARRQYSRSGEVQARQGDSPVEDQPGDQAR